MALLLSVTGCGRGDPSAAVDGGSAAPAPTSAPALVSQAAQKTRTARTGRFEGRYATVTGVGGATGAGASEVVTTMTGEYDLDRSASRMVLTAERDKGNALEQVQVGDTTYTRKTEAGVVVDDEGKPWARHVKDPASVSARTPDLLASGISANGEAAGAGALLDVLSKLDGVVTDAGRAPVRGVDTHHVRARVPLLSFMDPKTMASPQAACAQAGYERMTVDVDVFIDDDNYVRRVALRSDQSDSPYCAGGADPGSLAKIHLELSSTVDLFEFGTPVTITTPDPSQTRERY